jgi:hypothetical protein
MNPIFSKNTLVQLERRGIRRATIDKVLEKPDRIILQNDIKIFQSVIYFPCEGNFLVRIMVNTKPVPNTIITAYRTSKIEKYNENQV